MNPVSGEKGRESQSRKFERVGDVLLLEMKSIPTYGDQRLSSQSATSDTMSALPMIIADTRRSISSTRKMRLSTPTELSKLGYPPNITPESSVSAQIEGESTSVTSFQHISREPAPYEALPCTTHQNTTVSPNALTAHYLRRFEQCYTTVFCRSSCGLKPRLMQYTSKTVPGLVQLGIPLHTRC